MSVNWLLIAKKEVHVELPRMGHLMTLVPGSQLRALQITVGMVVVHVHEALGICLMEEEVFSDKDGRLVNNGTWDYKIPSGSNCIALLLDGFRGWR